MPFRGIDHQVSIADGSSHSDTIVGENGISLFDVLKLRCIGLQFDWDACLV